MRSLRFVTITSALAIGLSLALYSPTFGDSWAYDDIDYINLCARMLSGEIGVWRAIFYPHGEHLVAGFQALFFAYLRVVGIDAFGWRVGVAIVHSLSAIFLALLARRYAGSARAGIAATVVYIGACGFSSMWIWFPTGAPVPLMTALLTGSAALLAWRDHLTVRRVLAGVAVAVALVTESAFAPMALLPAVIDEYERRREGRRGIGAFSIWTLVAISATAVLVTALSRTTAAPLAINLQSGLPRAAYLILVAPFRFFLPGALVTAATDTGFAILGSVFGIVITSAVAALLIGLWRREAPPLAVIAMLSLPGSLGVIFLIGIGRSSASYQSLFATDRYFFPLLIPAALLAGAVTNSISFQGWSRSLRALLLLTLSIAVLGELALQRRAMLGPIPRIVYARHGARFASLVRLANLLDRAGPFAIPNQAIWFSDVHNGHLYTPVLTDLLCRGCDRLRLGGEKVDAATAARLNLVLDQWARSSGEPLPFLRVVNGRVINTRLRRRVDFSQGPYADRGLRGFYEWQKPYRWMGKRGEMEITIGPFDLTLTLAAPIAELRRRFGWSSLSVRATLVDVETGLIVPIGSVKLAQDGAQSFSLPITPFRSVFGNGRTARLVLECDRTWIPFDGSSDQRPHSVQVFAAGSDG